MASSFSIATSHNNPILPADPGRLARARIDELTDAFKNVIESGWFILGSHVAAFEESFSSWQQCAHSIGVASGTDALELCLRACGIGASDLVIVPTHTAVATAAAVCRVGAMPILLDVDARSFNLDLEQVDYVLKKSKFRDRIRAIVPVHLYGNPCNMTSITALAREHGLSVIEDCSQAHGATWNEKKVGSFSDAAAFSCYPTKNLGALGDAGLCVTDSLEMCERIRLLRQYGWRERYISDEIGMNSRLDELHAALLAVQLRYLDQDLLVRKRIANHYRNHLAGLPCEIPTTEANGVHAFHQFTIRVDSRVRDKLRSYLLDRGVVSSVLYPLPIHLQPAYVGHAAEYPLARSGAEAVCRSLLCLPIHPMLSDDELGVVCSAMRSFNW